MRLAVVLLSAALVGVGVGYAAAQPQTRLAITVYPHGPGRTGVRHYTLRCGPAGGTVPHPAIACRTLAGISNPFAPVPPGTICSQIALGPQEAVVSGRLRGAPVTVHLSVRDSCQIERWRRLAPVVPGFAGRP
jgi:hypothetical protein